MIPKLMYRAIGTFAVSLMLIAGAHASPAYDAVYVFGDSLSDVGNDYIVSGGTRPAPPYSNGQFSNGPVWLQTLASDLGLPSLTPSLSLVDPGTNYAYGGALSGSLTSAHISYAATNTDLTGPTGQIYQFETSHSIADPNALYTIEIGGNDIRKQMVNAPAGEQPALLGETVGNIDSAIQSLVRDGAKNFLVMYVADLGKAPEAFAAGDAATRSSLASSLNGMLLTSLAQFAGTGASFTVFNTYDFFDQIIGSPSTYGFTDVMDACYDATTGMVCPYPNQDLFWDKIHPTAAGHALLGGAVYNALPSAVPLPAGVWLLISGLGALGLSARKRTGA